MNTPSQPFLPRRAPRGRALLLVLGILLSRTETGSHAASGLDPAPEPLPESRAVRRLFANPPREYASGPLWVWNDLLTEKQIRDTLRDLAGQNVRQVFVHPRPGLMTPYLGPDWFRLWKLAVREAERLDMNVWIYDENSYPSGFAGGFVPELQPESRGMGLALQDAAAAPATTETNVVAVFRLGDGRAEDVTAEWRAGKAPAPGGSLLVARLQRSGNSPWHGNRSYVNLLTPGVTEKFLEVTLGAYDKALTDREWKRVPGVFTDEPNIRPAGGFPWCPDFAEQFRQRRGYDLLGNLASLAREVGDWRRVRHDYFATANELFIERWAKPYYDACERRGLESTGHYWDHEWPHCIGVPDNMAMAAWQHRPGVDTLMNQYAEHTHAQFGNVRYCREISSIANQLGRERTLVELYGAGGWDLRFEDMKRIADWLQVLGINTMDEHLSYVTLRGARKRDHPQSFSYHEPWWPAYHVHASYMTRLSAALSQGEQVNRVLVLEPTTTAWMYQGREPRLKEIGDSFSRLLMDLEAAQIEYDLGCEDVIARLGRSAGGPDLRPGWAGAGALRIGRRSYPVILVPEHTETLNARTRSLLNDLLAAGGHVIGLGPIPTRTAGAEDPTVAADRTTQRRWEILGREALITRLREWTATEPIVVDRAPGDSGILFHHRRELADGQLLFLVNTSIEHPSRGRVRARFPGVEHWNLNTGEDEEQPFAATESGVLVDYELPPSGSRLLFFSTKASRPNPAPILEQADVPASGPVAVRRVGPNVLVLDHVDLSVAGQTRTNQYFYAANRRVWQAHGLERNPWDSAVQFEDELITRAFPAGSGFTVTYRFTLDGPVPPDLALVVERPDLYRVSCNGQPVSIPAMMDAGDAKSPGEAGRRGPVQGRTVEFKEWWLDRAFGRMKIATLARTGENTITLQASPFTMWHEIEPIFVLGSFRLRPAEPGWIVAPDAPLALESPSGKGPGWHLQGHPFYSEGVAYRQSFDVADRSGRFTLRLPKWYGAVARVEVNGREAGWITSPPWECDVTRQVKRGANTVEITVIGTLRNTLGPHHGNHALGSAWPSMFQNGPASGLPPGDRYSTVGYGLFEPVALSRSWSRP